MSVEFRYANEGDYLAISQFLNDYWAAGHIYTRDKALFDWTFRRPGYWDRSDYSFAVGEENGELTGILGGIPFDFNCAGDRSKGIWIVNYVIRPDHRKGSGALKLLSMFRGAPFQATIAFGITEASSVIYRVLKGEVLERIPRYFAILPGQAARFAHLLSLAHPEWGPEKNGTLASMFEMQQLPKPDGPAGNALPEQWDSEDWPRFATETVGAARDRDYLTWRYQKHPTFEHHFIVYPENGKTGLAVWRLETIRRATEGGSRVDLDRIGRLLEFLPVSAANARNLLAEFFKQLSEAGAFGADYYGFHGESGEWLREQALRPVSTVEQGYALPSRFQPLDGKGGGILSAMFGSAGLPSCKISAECPWYWTKSDSDQDRPN